MTVTPAAAVVDRREPAPDKGWIERLLSPIADVRRGEATSALLMTATMFLLLFGYYLLKTAREGFILSEGGAEVKSYSSAGQAVMLLALVPAYGALASRVNRVQLIQWVTLFFASNLLLFLFALRGGLRVGIVFFLWVGIFNVMVIAQFWGFAADLYHEDQGKRLFPLLGVGSSLGAWFGSVRAGQIVASQGTPRLLIGGATILVICVVLARIANGVTARSPKAKVAVDQKLQGGPSGFSMLLSDRYLTLMALLVLLLNVVNTSGEYLFGKYVVNAALAAHGAGPESEAARQQFIGETYSSYFGWVNLIGFLLQMFVVSRVFKFLGVGRALFIHPIVAMVGYAGMLLAPSFAFIRAVKIADNSLDYSLGNTTKQALWLPTSREAKYKAKQAVDSFCQRAGDVLQAGIVYTGELTGLGITSFAAINVACVVGWLAVARDLNHKLHDRAMSGGRQEL
ncbi:MAG TPA: Npt1/Npt2 family nucleotide transporter [Vicinamibacterales bacterium]|nr:Npt1/Npt2 family nucleotide transporter [Vicinamibacterales bacterium]